LPRGEGEGEPNRCGVTRVIQRKEPGRDMVSLQICIENYGDYWTRGPSWYVRYVVRAQHPERSKIWLERLAL
jgi:hypothetical protein